MLVSDEDMEDDDDDDNDEDESSDDDDTSDEDDDRWIDEKGKCMDCGFEILSWADHQYCWRQCSKKKHLEEHRRKAVSYTHLTLPTILLV